MSRIQNHLSQRFETGRKALIPFITAGDPNPAFTVPALHALVAAGADIIELGVPFSDPMADGPVIQKASERALTHKMSLRRVLQLVSRFREQDQTTPVVLMGYLNPVEAMGYQAFAEQARAAGVDGVLIVDLPPEESAELVPLMKANGLDLIYLLAPNSTA
ncbi:tryptophan synthase subunit alpha, partial [Candidatus Woesearchaeota archaeon]|nr:tryptophan synthase subunit alpha [Candidatus Woesearchaeota archaeon]